MGIGTTMNKTKGAALVDIIPVQDATHFRRNLETEITNNYLMSTKYPLLIHFFIPLILEDNYIYNSWFIGKDFK